MTEQPPIRNELTKLITNGAAVSDAAFNHLALRVFHYQFQHNLPYRKYCERRRTHPDGIDHWLQIPAVPTAAFKEAALVCGDPADAEAVFRTSGTTQGVEKRGTHYVLDLQLYEQSLLPTFTELVLGGDTKMPLASLVPAWEPGGESSLAYMITCVQRERGNQTNLNAIGESGIDFDLLHGWIDGAKQFEVAVCIAGTSLAFVHWFDHLRATNTRFALPPGSRVMDTGGFKGSTRAISAQDLRTDYGELLGIDPRRVINEYGMTEMLSQFYDAHLHPSARMYVKRGPAWVRTAIVHPESLEPLPAGQTGLLRHFDLANLFSVSAIQTEDLGIMRDDGFELLGRATGAAPRGCSIAMDLFLSAART